MKIFSRKKSPDEAFKQVISTMERTPVNSISTVFSLNGIAYRIQISRVGLDSDFVLPTSEEK